ncbi:mitotic spindle assembly checkpoint protein MAD1 isoform X1 [Alosa sapidissima]|uniref:mitotic spindle assembly checkpoint protein MAD1 isoform X1 n=3 Tax=Alosa sapidissima TaxID=34773 RepID=UPI001C097E6A|nr:mitotic spindle assembly checkpoint protein MAD1 isoform X1 [Alosa sapidissima]XP_041960128.1 mitotic spindle assembly checkpoint protein MAD1 isoform X1 [Alosa sapidissima]XP_041960129.1 mitotic spindle assembly checkpoint protein MAD1 isoform X1 [Alosa sapidissima]
MDDLSDDTTVFSTLKSFKSFMARPERTPSQPTTYGSGSDLGKLYTQKMEMEESAKRIHSHTSLLQLSQEKQQMEMSHKRARIELEKAAQSSSRDLQREVDKNQDLQMRIRRLEEREAETGRSLTEQAESNKQLQLKIDELQKHLEEKDNLLTQANQTATRLKDEQRDLKQQLQTQQCKVSTLNLDKDSLQEQLEHQRKKFQEASQRLQDVQASQTSNEEGLLKIRELERRLVVQEQDSLIVRNMKTEVARVPDLERELKRLREENAFLRETRENSSLLKEEVEGLRKKLERMEQTREELLNMELQKEKLVAKIQAWENLGQNTGLNIRKPEDLSREVIDIQQREINLKQENYKLSSSHRSLERSCADLRSELLSLKTKSLEDHKKKDTQDALVRRLQKRVLLLTKERDGMRAILESYDSELASSEYSPQLTRRLKEAEELLQRVQTYNTDMEAQISKALDEAATFKLQAQTAALELEALKQQQASASEGNTPATNEEVQVLRLKVEELESERQRLEEQNNVLEMRLERHNLQGDYDPVKTKVVHLRFNPTSVAKQQRQEEAEQLREELNQLRELLRSGAMATTDTPLNIPPTQEVLDLRKAVESAELKNLRLKEVFQRKIQEFRTACYVLTGYQIDITTENQYRLTSVYAEHMDDSLLFKASGAVGSGSMNLLETDFSRSLQEMVELHLFHQKSIPAFLSAVTLELFSRQTTV